MTSFIAILPDPGSSLATRGVETPRRCPRGTLPRLFSAPLGPSAVCPVPPVHGPCASGDRRTRRRGQPRDDATPTLRTAGRGGHGCALSPRGRPRVGTRGRRGPQRPETSAASARLRALKPGTAAAVGLPEGSRRFPCS